MLTHTGSHTCLHTQTLVLTHGHTFVHVEHKHAHKCIPPYTQGHMQLQSYRHTDAFTHVHIQHTYTDTPSHTCTHNMHACKTHPCTHAHAHTGTGTAGAGTHNTLPRTSEEEEGRHIILFPLVQMTSLPWHQLCFDIFVIFLEHEDMGLKPSPQCYRWEMRFLAMNLPEQNDITTEERGGPWRVVISAAPRPGPCRGAAQRREQRWTGASLWFPGGSDTPLLWARGPFAPRLWSLRR